MGGAWWPAHLSVVTCSRVATTAGSVPGRRQTTKGLAGRTTRQGGHRAPSTEHRAPSTEHRAPSTEHRAPSTEHRAPSTEHRAPSTEHCSHGARGQPFGDQSGVRLPMACQMRMDPVPASGQSGLQLCSGGISRSCAHRRAKALGPGAPDPMPPVAGGFRTSGIKAVPVAEPGRPWARPNAAKPDRRIRSAGAAGRFNRSETIHAAGPDGEPPPSAGAAEGRKRRTPKVGAPGPIRIAMRNSHACRQRRAGRTAQPGNENSPGQRHGAVFVIQRAEGSGLLALDPGPDALVGPVKQHR